MKKLKWFFVAAILLAATGAFATKASSAKVLAAYPSNACDVPKPQPSSCGSSGTVVCTISGITWYEMSGCINALYFSQP